MKTDILGRKELENLVDRFYDKVKADSMLAPLFAHVNWERHLPVMYLFWENALFYSGGYFGNPIRSHKTLHDRAPLNEHYFDKWRELFIETVDELYAGEKADLAKQRATSISTVMQIKILPSLKL